MAIVRLDKVQATYNGNLESVQHTANMFNGSFVNLGALVAGEREIRNVVVPVTATLTTDELLLVAAPELMYLPGVALKDFVNPLGVPARAYHLKLGDIITVTDDLITGATTVGQYVIPANASLLLAAAATLAGGTRFAAVVIEKSTLGYNYDACTTFQVIKI